MASMREALEKAYDQDVGQAEDPPSPVGDASGEGLGEGVAVTESSEQELISPEPTDTPSEPTDESPAAAKASPKFLPAEEEGETGKKPAEPAAPAERPPVSWKGEAKGHWGELPPPVRQEVLRREKEITQALRDTAESRGFEQQFSQAVAPFQSFMQADRVTPLQAVQNLMQTAAVLRIGTPQQKAALVRDIIRQHQVDPVMLDSMLVGEQPSPAGNQNNQLFQYLDQRLAPVEALVNRFDTAQQNARTRQDQEISQEYDEFVNSGEAEYFEDVRELMADLLEIASRRNEKMSYKQAYERAIAMTPELASAVAQKKAAAERQAQTAAQQASIEKKKRASSSVQGTVPGANGATPPTNLRDQLAAAWDAQEGGA